MGKDAEPNKSTRIFAFTDCHASKPIIQHAKTASENCDMVICCGDFTIFGNAASNILKEFNSFGKPFMIIHGNHESESEIEKLCRPHKNLHFIHKSSFLLGNLEIFGFGGGGFSLRDAEFIETAKKFLPKMRENNKKGIKNILITHGPPYGTKLDDLYRNIFCGNRDYTDFIKKAPLSIYMCGHIHENFGKSDSINGKIILNPGPKGKRITIS